MPFYSLIFFSSLLHSVFIATRVTVSLYAIHLGATPFTIGTVMALFGLLPMLFAVGAGRLTDRIGPRTPMLAGAVMVSLGVLMPFLYPGLAMLYVAGALTGTGFLFYQISVQNIVGFIGKPEDRPSNFSLLALSFSVSAFVGPLATGVAIDGVGHRYAFLIFALLPLATIIAIASNRLALPGPRPQSPRAAPGRIADLLRHHDLRSVFILSALHAIAWELFTFMTPIYGTQIGLSASAIGVVMASFAAATFAIRMALAFLARRVTAWRLIRITFLMAAATYAIFPLAGSLAVLVALAFVLGIGLGSSQPMVMALLHDAVPEGRTGEAVGLRATIVTTGLGTMPLLFGALGTAFGVAPVFWAVAVVLAAGSQFALRRRGR